MTLQNQTTVTQISEILAHMQSGKSICQSEAYNQFGCQRLGGRVYDLKKRGHEIYFEWCRGTNRHGHRVAFKRYYLKDFRPVDAIQVEPKAGRSEKRIDAAKSYLNEKIQEIDWNIGTGLIVGQALKIAAGMK